MKSQTSSKVGHVRSKTRSLGQILEKPCVRSRGHIICLIIMKHIQSICLNKIWNEFENGHVRSKTRPLGQILEKPCIHIIGNIFDPIIMKLGQKVCLEISDEFENGSCLVKN